MSARITVDQTGTTVQPVIVGNATNKPVAFFEQITDQPSAMKVVVKPAKLQLTSESVKQEIREYETVATYFLNVPFVDGLISVSRIFKTLEQIAFNYEREHTDAFWQQYPEAVVLAQNEPRAYIDDVGWCRRNRRMLCRRFAHYIYHYMEARKLLAAATINVNVFARVNGNDIFADIASDARWAYINTRCKLTERFPMPKGYEPIMISAAKSAIGVNAYGSTVYAFPQYVVDVLGNRGSTIRSLTDSIYDKQNLKLNPDWDSNDSASKFNRAHFLQDIIDWTLDAYVHTSVNDNGQTDSVSRAPKPKSMRIENGATFSTTTTVEGASPSDEFAQPQTSAYTRLNHTNSGHDDDFYNSNRSNFTRDAWNAQRFWLEYLIRFFPEMMTPNSDMRLIAESLLNLLDKAMSIGELNKAVLAVQDCDLNSLATHMRYKDKCKTTTATTVKYSPLFYDQREIIDDEHPINLADREQFNQYSVSQLSNIRSQGVFNNGVTIFDMNFNRYPVDSYNITQIIKDAELYPKLTPTFFYDDGDDQTNKAPLCINAVHEVGDVFIQPDADIRKISATGKYAAILDYTLAYSHNPDETMISVQGISPSLAETFANTVDDNIVIFDEAPDNVFALVQPFIDCTDIYQCGFSIMVSNNEEFKSEWTNFLTSPAYYTAHDDTDTRRVDVAAGRPTAPVYAGTADGAQYNTFRQHVVNPDYVRHVGKAFVFVGMGVFAHPASELMYSSSDHYPCVFDARCGAHAADFIKYLQNNRSKDIKRAGMFDHYGHAQSTDVCTPGSEVLDSMAGVETAAERMLNRIYTFAPDYPPVLIAHEYNSAMSVGSFPFAPKFNDTVYQRSSVPPTAAPFKNVVLPRFDQTAVTGSATPRVNTNTSPEIASQRCFFITPRYKAMADLLFFLKSIVASIPIVCVDGTIIDAPGVCKYEFATFEQWQFTLTAQLDIMYPGLRDTTPFWSRLDSIKCNPIDDVAAASKDLETNDVLMPPRKLLAGKTANQPYSNQRNGARPASSEVNTGTFAHESRSNTSKPKYHHRNGKAKKFKNDFVNPSTTDKTSEDAFIGKDKVNAKKDSPTNMTVAKDEKFIEDSKKSPLGDTLQSLV